MHLAIIQHSPDLGWVCPFLSISKNVCCGGISGCRQQTWVIGEEHLSLGPGGDKRQKVLLQTAEIKNKCAALH